MIVDQISEHQGSPNHWKYVNYITHDICIKIIDFAKNCLLSSYFYLYYRFAIDPWASVSCSVTCRSIISRSSQRVDHIVKDRYLRIGCMEYTRD